MSFPDPTYAETVLAPLFDGVKTHFAADMDRINHAHLVMLRDTGILTPMDAAQIAAALRAISAETDMDQLSYTGAHEDYFFLIEHELRARLGDLGGALHTARSRNDMDHTLFRLALLRHGAEMQEAMLALIGAMISKAETEAETLIVAYTHGQPAQPSTFGHYLGAVIETALRDAQRLARALDDVDACPMGAAAITTTGFPIDRSQMAQLLGFTRATGNSYGSIAGVDYVTGLYSAIKLPFVHLGRVVQDFAFWSAFEVGQLHVPDAFVQVSSIMPQKRNPVPIEHLRHLASVTAGRCDMVVGTMHNTPHTDMNDSEGEVQQAGFAAFDSGGRMLRLMTALVDALSINADRVARTTDAACITITELADSLVRDGGLSFRQAHEICAVTARAVVAQGQPLTQGYDAFADAYRQETGAPPVLDARGFADATDPRSFVQRRTRPGGPAPAALAAALSGYRTALTTLIHDAGRARARRQAADQHLTHAFAEL